MTNNRQQPSRLVGRRLKKLQVKGDISCSQVPAHTNEGPKEEPVTQVDSRFLKSMINTMVNPISYKDKNGVFIWINKSYARQIFGLPEEEIAGHTLLEICTEFAETFDERSTVSGKCFTDICREWDKSDTDILESGRGKTYEQEVILADGTIGIFLVNRSTFKDENGEVLGLVTVLQDITELRMSEKALEKSEERYRIITEQTEQIVCDYDFRSNRGYLQGAVEKITGYPPLDFHGTPQEVWTGYIHPEDREYVAGEIMRAEKRGGKYRIEFRFRKKDGTYFCAEDNGVCLLDKTGKPYKLLGVIKDITERKLAQERLKISEEKYRSFTQNFKGIAFQLDENLIPEFTHGAVEEITGYSEEDFMSTRVWWMDIVHPEDQPAVLKQVMWIKNSPRAHDTEFEYRIKHKDGKVIWVNELYQKIPGKDGKPDKYQGAVYDITEKKEAEEALAEMKEARIKEIHHRIKNNLQVISSLLDLQAERFEDGKVREAFRESQNRIISMALIHEELYQEKGAETLNFAAYVQKLSESLFQTYRLDHPGVNLKTDLQENVFLDVDTAVPLGIIVNELVSNSLKHAFPGQKEGEIRISFHSIEKPAPKAGYSDENMDCERDFDYVLTVSDNGRGIPETIDFKNVESLGFHLVNILVEQIDGCIELKRGKGTKFILGINAAQGIKT
jgi:PAS domain S-box-containing protein